VPVGAVVTIQNEKLPHLRRWTPQPEVIIASNKTPAAADRSAPKPIAEKIDLPKESPRVVEKVPPTRTHGLFVGEGHRVLTHKAAEDLHRNRGPGFSNASDAMKGSILFADIPGSHKD
jgi:hypothetical protein